MTDLISRQAAIKYICTMLKNCFNATDEMLESVKITVGEMPYVPDTNVGDMISRQAAIDAICKDGTQRERQGQYSITMVDRKYLDTKILEALPSAQPGWIPVTERLPQNGYWLWSANGGVVKKDFYWDCHWELAEKYGYEVLAWMPLPKPWEGDANG